MEGEKHERKKMESLEQAFKQLDVNVNFSKKKKKKFESQKKKNFESQKKKNLKFEIHFFLKGIWFS